MNRRKFLSRTATGAALGSAPSFWQHVARAASERPGPDAPILVVVELTGGNDGLNTVVPYRDDHYHRSRPTLGIAARKVLKLDDNLGLHPAMTGLHKLWELGKLRVIANVGYPEPSRSHTRAMEIWQSGVLSPTPTTGWLGRLSDVSTDHAPSCFVGSSSTPLAVRGREVAPLALADLEGVKLQQGAHLATCTKDERATPSAHDVEHALAAAAAISEKVSAIRVGPGTVDRRGLDANLDTIHTLIQAGAVSRVYYTSLSGFDTHASQEFAHADLLRKLSEALGQFQKRLETHKLDDRVVVLVFSEFGRRLAENGSKGTDHGAAAPVFLLGSPVAAGLLGGPPDLTDLDEGDIRFTVDFRDLYGSLLSDWLQVKPSQVIGREPSNRPILLRS